MNDEVSTTNEEVTPPAELPRLRIHHLLVWMAVASVPLALQRTWMTRLVGTVPEEPTFLVYAISIAWILVEALAITGLVFGVLWWWQGRPFISQPDQWLLAVVGVTSLVSMFWNQVYLYRFSRADSDEWHFDSSIRPVLDVLSAWLSLGQIILFTIGLGAIAVWFVRGWRWRSFFALLAVSQVVPLVIRAMNYLLPRLGLFLGPEVLHWSYLVTNILPLAGGLVLVVLCVIDDYRKGLRYHWTHWLGIGAWIYQSVLLLVVYVVGMLRM